MPFVVRVEPLEDLVLALTVQKSLKTRETIAVEAITVAAPGATPIVFLGGSDMVPNEVKVPESSNARKAQHQRLY